MKSMIAVYANTDKGLKRSGNEDAYLFNLDLGLFIVADGMGGHEGGEIASSLAVRIAQETVQEMLYRPHMRPLEVVQRAFERANDEIFEKATRSGSQLQGMGTTMVLGLHWKKVFYIGNVGDSRAYLYRPPHLWQITDDHSLIAEQQRQGLTNAATTTPRNIITRSVGFEPHVIVDIFERPLQPNDNFLFCTDGLHSLVDDLTIARILNETPPEKSVDALIQEALKNGGSDNVTVMLIRFLGE